MSIEIIGPDGEEILNSTGVEAEAGNPNPEVVRETTNGGQVVWLTSSPERQSQES